MTERTKTVTDIKKETTTVAAELFESCSLKAGDIVIVGCSSSEVTGGVIGKNSSPETGRIIFDALNSFFSAHGIFVAAQCCEHLNRAVILETAAAKERGYEQVNVVPFPKAGGSFATAAYNAFKAPFAAESIRADAGIDIGGTLIGMHLKPVAVPVRISQKTIGAAGVICARTRPKLIGGERAHYDDELMK
ncbi:MAG: TIGR01440 family protein [Clostridia bacterium]|nr:TIGR01440 family protein [Clostridia bacterium]